MNERVPEGSRAYTEFARLYALAQNIRPTGVDRWNRQLYAATGDVLGGFDNRTGAIRIRDPLLREYLTGQATANRRRQTQALATVLHEATHAGMELDAPAERNAIRTKHSLGLTEGFAEVRAAEAFHVFTELAGYPGLVFTEPQYEGAFIATESLIKQVSGLRVDSQELIDRLARGPGVMHFDQLAEAVLQNRLAEVVPFRSEDRGAVRAALIGTMLHPQWQTLIKRPADAGQMVAGEIGRALNAKVEEIRHRYRSAPGNGNPFPGQPPNAGAGREAPAIDPQPAAGQRPPPTELRFLSGLAPAADAARHRPQLGDGRASINRRAARPGRSRE
jgi:hypothetical protein